MLSFNSMSTSGGFVDKYSAIPNFSLVNEPNLNKVLKAEVFVHTNGQLRAAHFILGYTPLSSSFQAPKCVIKARDRHLHLINVAVPGFLNPGLVPESVLEVEPFHQYTVKDEITPFQPAIKEEEEEEEEEEEKEEEEKVVEVSDSKHDFEVFNRLHSLEAPIGDFSHLPPAQVSQTQKDPSIPEAMGLWRRIRTSLLDPLESHVGGNVPEKAVQLNPPPFPPPTLPNLAMLTNRGSKIKREMR